VEVWCLCLYSWILTKPRRIPPPIKAKGKLEPHHCEFANILLSSFSLSSSGSNSAQLL